MVERTYRHCFETASRAAGRTLSDADLEKIFDAAQGRIDKYVRTGSSPRDAAMRAGKELADEHRVAAAVAKRNAINNKFINRQLMERVPEGKEAQFHRAIISSKEGNQRGLADSTDANMKAAASKVAAQIESDFREASLLKAVTAKDKAFDRDIGRELWSLKTGEGKSATGNSAAFAAAKIFRKYQDITRLLQNKAGAWIRENETFVASQTHDSERIRKVTADAWINAILPKLAERTFDEVAGDRREWLKQVYLALSTGVHEGAASYGDALTFKGPGNMAKKLSQGRVLHFKDADSWMDYNAQFGRGNVADAVMGGILRGARNAAIMERFGTNPEAMYDRWTDQLIDRAKKRGDTEAVKQIQNDGARKVFSTLTGEYGRADNLTLAQIGMGARIINQLTMLGGTLLSSFPDIAVQMAMLRHNGVGLMESFSHLATGLLPSAKAERARIADLLGVGNEALMGDIASRFTAEDGKLGQLSETVNSFHKWTGMSYWNDAVRRGAATMVAYNLSRNTGRAFDELPARFQAALRRYGIEAPEWQAFGSVLQEAENGKSYLLPSHIADLPDEAVAHLPGTANHARNELERKLRLYVLDQVDEGMSEANAATTTMAHFGTQRGTVAGELVRAIMQFKSYTINFMTRGLGRELMRMGDGNTSGDMKGLMRAVRTGADLPGIAILIASTTALGYVSMTLKDLAKGRNPRKPEDAGDYAKLLTAAMAQGGGAGIFGDFLFGEANRFGGGFAGTLMGPTLGDLGDVANAYQSIRDGWEDRGAQGGLKEAESQALRLTMAHVPFGAIAPQAAALNTFYGKMAMQYLVYYRLQEMMNPGYLQRFQNKVQQQNNQSFWLSPTWNPYQAAGVTQ
ncbi:hypothetical protein [Gluconobacter wancherniae]|uniref:hypothetical protein n=1 Tax=Gluconobacter wancherniae TaxID=1307955 RepID=UPI001B8D60DD|nr:hypothetical protein [Gluconobacter wancherniae]MBS1088136.1 hypothetical protein [Gluconobacter wancherniae]